MKTNRDGNKMKNNISVFVQETGCIGLSCAICNRTFWKFTRKAVSARELEIQVTNHIWSSSVLHARIENERVG